MYESPLVTVIMPVYNTEPFVSEAIDSILGQTLKSLELICVNDGSTDQSGVICDKYATIDKRVVVIEQSNSGQGCARNRALKLAHGKFIYFMDSDDILLPTALEEVCLKMIENKLDLLFFEAHTFGEIKAVGKYRRDFLYDDAYSGAELASLLLKNNEFIVSPCLYVASADLYQTNGIRFLEDHVKHEDDIFTILALLYSKRATCLHQDLYARRYRPGSTMTSFDPVSSVKGAFRTYSELIRRREMSCSTSVLRSSVVDEFLDRCKQETIRYFSHCNIPLSEFTSIVECKDDMESRVADDITDSVSAMRIKFYFVRYLRLIKRKLFGRLQH